MHPCGDPNKQALPTFFLLKNADNEQEIKDWPVECLTQYEKPVEQQIGPEEAPLENMTQLRTKSSMQEPEDSSQVNEAEDNQDLTYDSHNDPAASEDLTAEQARKRRGKQPMEEDEDEDTLSLPRSKQKRVDNTQRRDIPDEYLTLLCDAVAEVIEKTLSKLVTRQSNLTAAITTQVNQLV